MAKFDPTTGERLDPPTPKTETKPAQPQGPKAVDTAKKR